MGARKQPHSRQQLPGASDGAGRAAALLSPAVAESGRGRSVRAPRCRGRGGHGRLSRRRALTEPLHVEGRKLCVPARRPRRAGQRSRAGKGSSAAAPGARSQPASPRTPPLPSAARRAAAPVSSGRIRPGAAGPDSHPRPRASALAPGLGEASALPAPEERRGRPGRPEKAGRPPAATSRPGPGAPRSGARGRR